MRISDLDLGWAVGFLEGEGSFIMNRWNLVVTATQKTLEPLTKLQSIFKCGKIIKYEILSRKGEMVAYHRWDVINEHSHRIIKLVYPHLSARRKMQVDLCIEKYVNRPKKGDYQRHKTACKRGHDFTLENTYIKNGRYRECRKCAVDYKANWYQINKEGNKLWQ